jgi:hypothetical protein
MEGFLAEKTQADRISYGSFSLTERVAGTAHMPRSFGQWLPCRPLAKIRRHSRATARPQRFHFARLANKSADIGTMEAASPEEASTPVPPFYTH